MPPDGLPDSRALAMSVRDRLAKARADPRDRAEIYSRIGFRMTYRPGTETLLTRVVSTAINHVPVRCPRPHTARPNPVHGCSES
jgi:site-specific DNA recombinase